MTVNHAKEISRPKRKLVELHLRRAAEPKSIALRIQKGKGWAHLAGTYTAGQNLFHPGIKQILSIEILQEIKDVGMAPHLKQSQRLHP